MDTNRALSNVTARGRSFSGETAAPAFVEDNVPDIVFFDLETTGTDVDTCKIVQIAAVRLNEYLEIDTTRKSMVNPGIPIPKEASDIHEIFDKDVNGAPRFDVIADRIIEFFDDALIAGYNILQFDLPVLQREFLEVGIPFEVGKERIIDVYALFCHFMPRTLAAAFKHYTDTPLENAHDALADVKATIDVFASQLKHHANDSQTPMATWGEANRLSLGDRVTLDGKIRWDKDGEMVIPFGKHAGKTLRHLAFKEPSYLRWMLDKNFSEETKAIITESLAGNFQTK